MQVPQAPLELQVCVPQVQSPEQLAQIPWSSQVSTEPGVQTAQMPLFHWQLLLQWSVSVPPFPWASEQDSLRLDPAVHTPWPAQDPVAHWQLVLQVSVSVPHIPQLDERVFPGAQTP